MFCGNCGNEVESGAAFCPVCGSPVEASNKKGVDSKKVGKLIAIIVAVIAVVIVATVGLKVYSYIKSKPTDKQLELAVNNYQNGGIVTTDGKWLYYNDNGLCKVLLKDGSKQTSVSDEVTPEKMFYAGNSIFYYKFPGIYKAQADKWKENDLKLSVFTEDCFQTDGKNYYVTGQGNSDDIVVYSVSVSNEKKRTQISDIHPTRLLMYKDYIYIQSGFDSINDMPNENFGTWRISKDGKNKIDLMGFCPSYMVFSGDRIFYTNEDRVICSMSLDGSDEQIYEDTCVNGGLNVTDDYVFFIGQSEDNYNNVIYRMDKDGGDITALTQDDCSSINIAGDWIYYVNEDYDYDIYKMSFDGSYNAPIY